MTEATPSGPVLAALLAFAAGLAALPAATHAQRATIPIVIETELGTIEAELDSARAPITVGNFLRYVDAKLFDDARFFRSVRMDNQPNDSVKIEVIQAARAPRSGGGPPDFPPIPLERTSVSGIRHLDGTLSMARSGPDTGTSSFSIVINDQPSMDFGGHRNPDGQGFAAFGRVTSGMDVARKIQAGAVEAQRLVTPVRIARISRK
jgi:peptidyl-prolyl cis-trans isomerase A (cyclophilin A)